MWFALSQLHKPRLTLILSLACGVSLTGCASVPAPLTITLPDSLRTPCQSADHSTLSTLGDLAALAIRQEAALQVCEARRSAVVEIVDSHTAIVAPKRKWWQIR